MIYSNNVIDRLRAIKKANNSKLHDFYYLRDKCLSLGLNQCLLTFTYKEKNPYFKMQVINEIKNYLGLLIRNTRDDNIKIYSNIELGENYLNSHLHSQIYYKDIDKILTIRDKVIKKFGLVDEFCTVTMPKMKNYKYDYSVKDYKIKDNYQLLLLDDYKRHYRVELKKNLRFTSFSKEKYSKAIYKKAYSKGILKANADYLLDNCIIDNDINVIDNRVINTAKILILIHAMRFLIQYIEQEIKRCFTLGYDIKKTISQIKKLILHWIYGFV